MNEGQAHERRTARLNGRPITAQDFDALRPLHADRAVMRTLSADGLIAPEAHTRNLIERLVAHWREHGDGVWLFRALDDGRAIGYGGLLRRVLDGAPECELIYAVMSAEWRKGYATEMARAVLAHAFERRREPSVVALTLEVNAGSRRVIERLGFALEKTIAHAGLPHLFFRLSAAAYRGGRGWGVLGSLAGAPHPSFHGGVRADRGIHRLASSLIGGSHSRTCGAPEDDV